MCVCVSNVITCVKYCKIFAGIQNVMPVCMYVCMYVCIGFYSYSTIIWYVCKYTHVHAWSTVKMFSGIHERDIFACVRMHACMYI